MYSGSYRGGERKGEWFQLYSIGFGGIPGRPLGDGPDGHSLWPSFVNIPCEFLESYYPLRIEKWETVADTGGAGLHRGGNGVDVAYHFLEPGTIAIHDDRWLTYPWGVNGGTPGARGTQVGRPRRRHPRGAAQQVPRRRRWRPATCCTSSPGAAAGWGDPLERDPELVALEVRRGLVTAEGARRYGVVVSGDGAADAEATRSAARRSCGLAARLSCPFSTWGRRWRRSWPGARRRPACPRHALRSGHDQPRPDQRDETFGGSLGWGAGRRCC